MMMTKKEKTDLCGIVVTCVGLTAILLAAKFDLFGLMFASMALTIALLAIIDRSPVLWTIAFFTALATLGCAV